MRQRVYRVERRTEIQSKIWATCFLSAEKSRAPYGGHVARTCARRGALRAPAGRGLSYWDTYRLLLAHTESIVGEIEQSGGQKGDMGGSASLKPRCLNVFV